MTAAVPSHLTAPSPPPLEEEKADCHHDDNGIQSSNFLTSSSSSSNEFSAKARFKRQIRQSILPLSFTLPYIIGLIWTVSHPLVSVITGELKCRGSYIDEHGLDVHRHRVAAYPTVRHIGSTSHHINAAVSLQDDNMNVKETRRLGSSSMCDTIRHFTSLFSSSSLTLRISPSIECYHHVATPQIAFDIVRILPSIGPSIDVVESIVLVVDSISSHSEKEDITDSNNNEWYTSSDMNASILHLISKLGNGKETPWLSKVVLIVSPTRNKHNASVGNGNQVDRQPALLDSVVDAFIASYFLDGGRIPTASAMGGEVVRPLPPDFTFPMIRSLLVIHDDDDINIHNVRRHEGMLASSMTEIDRTSVRILPHGIGGSLPNLDLVFATLLSFQSHPAGGSMDRSASIYYGNSDFSVHPRLNTNGAAAMKKMEERITAYLTWIVNFIGMKDGPMIVERYVNDWMGLVRFVLGMAIGPRQPHASALQHGIDSLTIQVHIPNKKENTNTSTSSSASASSTIHPHYADFTRCLEHLLRSISNLHERLHHSVSQYLLPSPTKFVSHGEYIYPGLLISIPMVIRAAILALRDIKRFQVKFVGYILAWDGLVSFGIGIVCVATSHQQQLLRENDAENTTNHEWMMKTVYFLSYAMIIFAMVTGRDGHQKGPSVRKVADEDEHYECQKSLRFVVCLLGVYLHAPLLLANYSLGLPSAVFWSPLLGTIVLSPSVRAFLSRNRAISLLLKIVGGMFLIATSPPVLLVPSIFPSYTVYILGVYTPLHLLLVVLWMM